MELVVYEFAARESQTDCSLELVYEDRLKSRNTVQLPGGETLHYILKSGTSLKDGDKLLAHDAHKAKKIIAIIAAPEKLIEARALKDLDFIRAVYHLGNRHVQTEIKHDENGWILLLQPDPVLEGMLRHLQCQVKEVFAPFQPEGGAYEGEHRHHHGHSHAHDTGSDAKIHSFSS